MWGPPFGPLLAFHGSLRVTLPSARTIFDTSSDITADSSRLPLIKDLSFSSMSWGSTLDHFLIRLLLPSKGNEQTTPTFMIRTLMTHTMSRRQDSDKSLMANVPQFCSFSAISWLSFQWRAWHHRKISNVLLPSDGSHLRIAHPDH